MRLSSLVALGLAASVAACSSSPSAVVDSSVIPEAPSLRGLSRVDQDNAWVSGGGGSVARSSDGGQTWQLLAVPGASELDFRDVHAFTPSTAVLMSAGPADASRILRTEDGGDTWQLVATNNEPEGFWDGIAFWDTQHGLLVGDPVGGSITVMTTSDGGRSWTTVAPSAIPTAFEGEFAFAASGTSLAVQPGGLAWIATGGAVARVYISTDYGRTWQARATPIAAGSAGAGIFSIAFRDPKRGIIVGGDYMNPEHNQANAAFTQDGGLSWTAVTPGFEPAGYRSGCSWGPKFGAWVAVGPTGADFSTDGGRTWAPLASDGFHSVDQEWASGWEGRVGRVIGTSTTTQ